MGQENISSNEDVTEITAANVREIVTPVLLDEERLSDDDISIIIQLAKEMGDRDDVKASILESAARRFEAKGKLEKLAPAVAHLIVDHQGVVGAADSLEGAKDIIKSERENMDPRNTF